MEPRLIIGMNGLGDSIYQRPYVRWLAGRHDVYLANSWPQLYADLPVRFVRHPLRLRTQEKNVRALPPDTWSEPPPRTPRSYLGYELSDPRDNVFTDMDRHTGRRGPIELDLPPLPPCPVESDRPIAVVRPVTERGEWLNQARNCDPRYVAEAAQILAAEGFHVVSVADLQRGIEMLRGPAPYADTVLHRGELAVDELMALVAGAAVVVGPIGWILPACLATRTPCVLVGGGHGKYNRPERLTDPRLDLRRVRWIMPRPQCMCADMRHRCHKRIAGFAPRLGRALGAIVDREAVAA